MRVVVPCAHCEHDLRVHPLGNDCALPGCHCVRFSLRVPVDVDKLDKMLAEVEAEVTAKLEAERKTQDTEPRRPNDPHVDPSVRAAYYGLRSPGRKT